MYTLAKRRSLIPFKKYYKLLAFCIRSAIYTRYKNKDELFISLLQDFFKTMEEIFSPAAEKYERAKKSALTEDIIRAINVEEGIYFRLLTEHYDECTLFFSRSDGSSAETMRSPIRANQSTIVSFIAHASVSPEHSHRPHSARNACTISCRLTFLT